MSKITYTFPADCPVAELRGQTLTRGEFCRVDGKWQGEPDAVRFAERIDGHAVMARIAGKPELEAALAADKAQKQAIADRLASIGWPQYKIAQSAVYAAREDYDHASEHGYPVDQAIRLRKAEEALAVAAQQYPQAAAYALAESYSMASNYAKAGAGRKAMEHIEQCAEPMAAIATMKSEWSADAERMVQNA